MDSKEGGGEKMGACHKDERAHAHNDKAMPRAKRRTTPRSLLCECACVCERERVRVGVFVRVRVAEREKERERETQEIQSI